MFGSIADDFIAINEYQGKLFFTKEEIPYQIELYRQLSQAWINEMYDKFFDFYDFNLDDYELMEEIYDKPEYYGISFKEYDVIKYLDDDEDEEDMEENLS